MSAYEDILEETGAAIQTPNYADWQLADVPGALAETYEELYAVVAKGGHIQNNGQWMTGLDEVS